MCATLEYVGGGSDTRCDDELLARWTRSGDVASRDLLFRRHYARIHRFFDVKVPWVADDLTQQTLLTCAERMHTFNHQGSFAAYVFGIARNHLLRYRRVADRDAARLVARSAELRDQGVSPSGVVAVQEEQWLLLRAMDRLPDDLRIAIQLYYWENMSGPEIGEVLRVPFSTVTTRLSRARERLRAEVIRLTRPGNVRDRLAERLEDWTRSLVQRAPDESVAGDAATPRG